MFAITVHIFDVITRQIHQQQELDDTQQGRRRKEATTIRAGYKKSSHDTNKTRRSAHIIMVQRLVVYPLLHLVEQLLGCATEQTSSLLFRCISTTTYILRELVNNTAEGCNKKHFFP